MVFDAADGQLIGLDVSITQQNAHFTESDEVLIFPVEEQTEVTQIINQAPEPNVKAEPELFEETFIATEQQIDNQFAMPVVDVVQQVETMHLADQANLMPQDILKLREQVLEGEWNLDKWEYWFRNSELSPAVQELAQHGIMQGHINGSSVFHIPQKYEGMLSQLRQALEDALKSQWPNTQFNVQYQDIDSITPFTMQVMRKEKAFHRAVELLQQEPAIKSLIETFDGELQNIQLKS